LTNITETDIIIIHKIFTADKSVVSYWSKKMKKIAIIFVCFWLLTGFLVIPVAAEDGYNSICSGIDAANAIVENKVITNATAAVVYELNSGTMMYSSNIDERMYPASLVKVMTALLAVENRNLNSTATVTQEALNAALGSTSAGLQAGEQLTVLELLYCMLTGSANDAAAVLAVHIGGSIESFVGMMNSRAAELGCTDTNFTDPHGLGSRNQYTTARDMVRIFAAAAENETFCEIFGAVKHTVPATNHSPERELKTVNYLMDKTSESYYDSRVTGGRTGTASDRSRCLGVIANAGNMKAVAIVFGAKSQFAADGYTVEHYGSFREISQLLNATISSYRIAQVFYEDQILAQRPVSNGDNDLVLSPAGMQTVIVPKDIDLSEITYRFTDAGKIYSAPIVQGSPQGSVEVWYGGKCLAKAMLVARNHVAVAADKRVTLQNSSGIGTVLLVIVLLIAVGAFILYARRVRARKKRAARKHSARRRRQYE